MEITWHHWKMHGQHLDQLWYIFKTIVGQLWDNFKTTFGSLWNNFVTTLKLLWDNIETTFRQLRDNFETTLGQLGDNSERTLIQDWDHIGTTQWPLAERTSALWVGSIWSSSIKHSLFHERWNICLCSISCAQNLKIRQNSPINADGKINATDFLFQSPRER